MIKRFIGLRGGRVFKSRHRHHFYYGTHSFTGR